MAAAIWAPNAPPIVRMIVFMPVASPVCACGTASTIRFAIEANDRPIPNPSTVTAATMCHGSEWATASIPKLVAANAVPSISGTFEPARPASIPAAGPATSMITAEGSMNRPAAVTSAPKP
jgi:hypothetical protein